jgi:acetamidase/formamidase
VFEHACKLGCEGIVSKRRGSRYARGRSSNWLKVKNPDAPAVRREYRAKRPYTSVISARRSNRMGGISTSPPGVHAGNIDNKDFVAGATLFMPVYTVRALFSVSDGHAAQGQGEVDLSAIEIGNRGKFQFIVRKDIKLTWPRAETPSPSVSPSCHARRPI